HVIAECQKKGGTAAFIDAEHALDPQYARNLGVDIDKLIVSQPDNGEQGLDIAEALVRSGAVDLVVVDSVAALVPKTEIEGAMGDATIGLQARLMSQAMRKLSGVISKTNSTVIFINQLREKIGIMFGSPETTTGGKALKFYSSVRLDIRKFDVIKQKEETAAGKKEDVIVGNRVRVKVVKNKVAPPFKVVEFDIMYGTGISREGDILDVAVDRGIVEKAGAWFSYNDEKLGQGRENVKQLFKEKPELMEEIELKVRQAYKKEDEEAAEEAEENTEE
ncbi:MAG: recombinase RecA, partial [Fenollaria timonensis]